MASFWLWSRRFSRTLTCSEDAGHHPRPPSARQAGRCSLSSVVREGALERGREAWSGPHGGSRLPSKDGDGESVP